MKPWSGRLRAGVFLVVMVMSLKANAQLTFPPITNRNFNIDLFEQPALGSPRLIAMSGAIDAVAEGAAGLYTNPASAAVRPETKIDKFAWNVYFNSYVAGSGQDSNDNGQLVTSGKYGWSLVVTGTGATIAAARRAAYETADKIFIPKLRFRRDIGETLIRRDWARVEALGLLSDELPEPQSAGVVKQ